MAAATSLGNRSVYFQHARLLRPEQQVGEAGTMHADYCFRH